MIVERLLLQKRSASVFSYPDITARRGANRVVRIVNFLLYQVGWFACVLGAAWGFPWFGMSIALCLLGIHFRLAPDRGSQVVLVLAAAGAGLVVDTLQLWVGVFTFPHGTVVDWLPPPWMSVLWMQFATTFRYSMRWLEGRYLLSASFGLLGAPVAFFAGERFGAIEFLSPRLAHYGVLAVLWSITVPLLVYVSDRLSMAANTKASEVVCSSEPLQR